MKFLSLDIATVTGWSVVEDRTLIEFGSIHIDSSMNIQQRLNFLSVEIKRIIERLRPDYCVIEDVILGISGAKTLIYLARLNGAALITCYNLLKENVLLFSPDKWKANSIEGLNGHAKKWQVQYAVCKYFHLDSKIDLSDLLALQSILSASPDELKKKLLNAQNELISIRSEKRRKRSPPTKDRIDQIDILERTLIDQIKNIKVDIKNFHVNNDKFMHRVSLNIMSTTGISTDVSDSIALAICAQRSIIPDSNFGKIM